MIYKQASMQTPRLRPTPPKTPRSIPQTNLGPWEDVFSEIDKQLSSVSPEDQRQRKFLTTLKADILQTTQALTTAYAPNLTQTESSLNAKIRVLESRLHEQTASIRAVLSIAGERIPSRIPTQGLSKIDLREHLTIHPRPVAPLLDALTPHSSRQLLAIAPAGPDPQTTADLQATIQAQTSEIAELQKQLAAAKQARPKRVSPSAEIALRETVRTQVQTIADQAETLSQKEAIIAFQREELITLRRQQPKPHRPKTATGRRPPTARATAAASASDEATTTTRLTLPQQSLVSSPQTTSLPPIKGVRPRTLNQALN